MSQTATKTTELTDFPDKFSPMLVKELRQGLRTNLFITAFILLQGFMILCIVMGSAESNSNDAANGFFWFFIIVALVVVQPLRGFSTLSNEFTLNTMDLIQMTRLDAWRITWGKWLAINAQTFLLVAAVAPYLVLRYFFGSINIFADLGLLGLCTVASALLSAITVGCSAFKNLIVRIAMLIGCSIVFSFLWGYTVQQLLNSRVSGSEIKQLCLLIYTCVFGAYFFLAFGASRIAPGSENISTAKRLIGLAFAIGAWAFQLFGTDKEVCNVIACMILGLVVIDALSEELPVFGSVLRPFSPAIRRPFAYLLTPGWHTGIIFFSLIGLPFLLIVVLNYFNFAPRMDEIGFAIHAAGMITFPLIFIRLFFRNAKLPQFALYLFIQAVLAAVTILTLSVAQTSVVDEKLVYLFVAIPAVLFFGSSTESLSEPVYVIIGVVWLLLSILVPLLYSLKHYRAMTTAFNAPKIRPVDV